MTANLRQHTKPAVGDVYQDKRYSDDKHARLQVIYLDEQVALLRDYDDSHRLERRTYFDTMLGERLTFVENQPIETDAAREDWTEVHGIGETAAENLHDAGIETKRDVLELVLPDLTEIGGVGKKNGSNLQDYCR